MSLWILMIEGLNFCDSWFKLSILCRNCMSPESCKSLLLGSCMWRRAYLWGHLVDVHGVFAESKLLLQGRLEFPAANHFDFADGGRSAQGRVTWASAFRGVDWCAFLGSEDRVHLRIGVRFAFWKARELYIPSWEQECRARGRVTEGVHRTRVCWLGERAYISCLISSTSSTVVEMEWERLSLMVWRPDVLRLRLVGEAAILKLMFANLIVPIIL